MNSRIFFPAFFVTVTALFAAAGCNQAAEHKWAIHDRNRPRPPVITPGEAGTPPSDAVVLFDGTDLSKWESAKGGQAGWKVESGYMEVAKKSGSIRTKEGFGSCQLHVEWATPETVAGDGQKPGNSGVFFMGLYEVQVLDSYENITYADGQAAAIYGQSPPMVNACRPPGQWQSFDIIFHRPVFKEKKVKLPATITVFHNGVLVQDNWVIEGPTSHKKRAGYQVHEDRLPIMLQDHGNPVRYRNVWLRELE